MQSVLSTSKSFRLVLLLAITACGTVPRMDLKTYQSQAILKPQALKLSAKAWLPRVQAEALNWQKDAYLTGVYAFQLSGKSFLSYEFQSGHLPEKTLYMKMTEAGVLSQTLSQTQQVSERIVMENWKTSEQEALALARTKGFNALDDFGVGLGSWKGMGIANPGLKWSVLSFADPNTQYYYVIDDQTLQVWRCEPTSQPNQGCLPTVKNIFLSLRNLEING
ncbi:hypothetical protein COW36_08115 [bacterium (Candidatus Blackallbacteria) CG17_big_fil_post_rev_8_21_14_2_50_48_46]|uniref:Uncharacterized protein n=1 Tax=bacterium (Candidatus Blackallbacteria) CG17_big_fil_post_rev_8_21_14_2_50_48_46 TaxID=2014261 RepID=A0A2M7G609_9BACT|nr:MAG: hypothetical protein COW64_24655 [bacterium (Candidatus Blackallbacteria) CG18_big_fil_WC_8_21_14_2_50_49_26]PIW17454.1 MAG: hypothetical protein COW36_08115 [bacterium (Candidatus Blackallbacteria) CG17_big_fil_post_rev_8_21_14_2_50_48_46]PIW48308.1 MAG: hypothetical protein COW20_09470 [bacterium (Candidatus Blackallbacteria) CG13_big_fil_rev_8_21_14_2_50_49_14]